MSRLHNTTSTDVDESRCARELLSDPAAVAAFLQRLMRSGDVHEIRIPHPRRGGPRRLYRAQAGYFDRAETAGLAVRGIGGGDAAGVYVTLNPVAPALLARSDNVLRDADTTAGDKDIARRTNLLIDCDPVRHPADVSATDEEMALAVERRDLVIAYLRDLGWPEPVAVAMSGNGGSAIYRIDLANDDDATALVKNVLAALDHLFSDERVIVDASNFNASRLTKLVGTVATKGDDFQGRPGVPARPWRLSAATYPAGAGVVTREQLAAVAALAPVEEPERRPLDAGGRGSAQRTWTIEQLLELNGLTARRKRMAYATVWQLECCPTSSEHADGAILFEMQNGAVGYRCLHNSCSSWNWQRLREEGLIAIPGEQRQNGHKPKQDTLSALSALNAQGQAQQDDASDDGEQPPAMPTVWLKDVQVQTLRWLVPGRVAYGKLNLLVGKPGRGKSFITLDYAARLTTGTPMPGEEEPPAKGVALFWIAEDDLADTVRPRFDALHGDVERFATTPFVREAGGERMPNLARDLPLLRAKIEEIGATFVVIDPLNAYLAGIDGNDDIKMRTVFTPLAAIAADTGAAIVGVTHANKRAEGDALERVMGSMAYVAAARSVLGVGQDPDTPGRNVLVQIKSNLAAQAPAMGYRLVDGVIAWDDQPASVTADTIFDSSPRARDEHSALAEAKKFLQEVLAGGRQACKHIEAEAKQLGISTATLRRAREDLGVTSSREGFGADATWFWTLDETKEVF